MQPNIPFEMPDTINRLIWEDLASKESSKEFIACLDLCGFYPVNKCEIMTELPIIVENAKDKPLSWTSDTISPTDNLLSYKCSKMIQFGNEDFQSWNI